MFNIGASELILILLIAFLVVGPKDLPRIGRALGRGMKYARNMVRELKKETGLDEVDDVVKDIRRDLKDIGKAADVTPELRDLRKTTDGLQADIRDIHREVETTVKDAQDSVRSGTESDIENGGKQS